VKTLIRAARLRRGAIVAAVAGLALSSVVISSAASAASVKLPKSGVETPSGGTVTETGSTLLYPLFNLWSGAYSTQFSSTTIQTAGTGSGTGISEAENGTIDIGASDAYLSPSVVSANPDLKNIPTSISAQMVAYNIPGVLSHLKLSGKILSAIYQGQITKWNDAKIAALNPGVTLPATPIVTVHRSDSSGDTFLFSSFLTASDPSGWTIPPGTTVAWPNVAGAVAAQGNGGMVQACQKSAGCIAYIGVSYLSQVTAAGLGYASLKNKAGNFELPSQAAIGAAAAQFATSTPASGAVSMIFGSASDGYPIVNYEYGIIPTKQPSALAAQAVKAVLAWAVDPNGGNAPTYLDQVNFVALPSQVVSISTKLISQVAS